MKYKAGNQVRIKSINWYDANNNGWGVVCLSDTPYFISSMKRYCGKVMTIAEIDNGVYHMKEDNSEFDWSDEMIEGLVEEETPLYKAIVDKNGNMTGEFIRLKGVTQEINLPEGYMFKDENGNVINTTKIILEKKKKKYPKTYEECSLINGCEGRISLKIIGEFTRLINARNAYWKIAGEEMGLGKPWEPNFKDTQDKYFICYLRDELWMSIIRDCNRLLVFPTEEMRDTFYENFKELIEECKELL